MIRIQKRVTSLYYFTQICIYLLLQTFSTDPVTTVVEEECTDGEIRLSNGSNALEGRVEICYNRAWGTVCTSGFAQTEADVVCSQNDRQFGYAHSGSTPLRDGRFGEGEGPIFIDNIGCDEEDTSLSGCSVTGLMGFYECDHSQDSGVICEGNLHTIFSSMLSCHGS